MISFRCLQARSIELSKDIISQLFMLYLVKCLESIVTNDFHCLKSVFLQEFSFSVTMRETEMVNTVKIGAEKARAKAKGRQNVSLLELNDFS